ncbi:protein atonal homolog 8-like [Galendromus occidentalis]|uniref:Protein atonal homolog 8-like n=1 Tax=Galendromus occidentalis TaxID=34638 RepID=A0AAJ7SG19_9ACAR|nr:protein atonal homolog 8-like [Galendromus occidentalis]
MALCSVKDSKSTSDQIRHQSDEDSGVEFGQSPLLEVACINHRKKLSHSKKRSLLALRKSLCSDSGISDHERPASRDSSSRLPSSPEVSCLDLTLKDTLLSATKRSAIDDSSDVDTSDQLPPIKKEKADGDLVGDDRTVIRQRRIEANARERTRVHTIGAAFDSLRKSIPAFSDGQKLSKLAILRVASSYILALSSLLEDQKESFAESVQACSSAIHLDGKIRRR